jgi:hypothetical protein
MSAMGFVFKAVCVAFALAGLTVTASADVSLESGRRSARPSNRDRMPTFR